MTPAIAYKSLMVGSGSWLRKPATYPSIIKADRALDEILPTGGHVSTTAGDGRTEEGRRKEGRRERREGAWLLGGMDGGRGTGGCSAPTELFIRTAANKRTLPAASWSK